MLYLVPVFTTTSSVHLLKRGSKPDLEDNHDTKGAVDIMEKNNGSEIKTVKINDPELSQQIRQLFQGLK